jgi:hypothetical protein
MGSNKKKEHSNKKKKNPKEEEEEIDDARFQAAVNRPQFSKPTKQDNKVVLDDRFASVLTDPRFSIQEKDKYGRKQKSEKTQELSAFYKIETKDDDKSSEQKDEEEPVQQETSDDDDSLEDPADRIKYLTALSRGELSVSSSSSENESDDDHDSDSSDDERPQNSVHGSVGVLDPSSQDKDVPITNEASPYIAVMDMDWKHVRAVDLFAILSSFTPPGAIKRVQVFPSNFGLERMAKEAQQGPVDLWKKNKLESEKEDEDESVQSQDEAMDKDSESENNSQDEHEQYLKLLRKENEEKESDFDTEKLRAYEASKLKYYFAVVEFTLPEYADVAYKEVDGLELEHSSAAMDLRAIPPDEVDGIVKDRQLRDEATSIPSNYQPPDFVISALQQSSVQCTWEDGDEERQRKLTSYGSGQPGSWGATIEEDDLRAYLASDVSTSDEEESGDDSDNGGGKGSKIRKMLGLESSDDDNENNGENEDESSSEDEEDRDGFSKQVTFIPGKAKLEDRIRSKLEEKKKKELTHWEKYQQKRKEKRRERRQARRKLRKNIDQTADGSGSDPESVEAGFGSEDEIVGVDDDFFLESAEATSKAKATRAKDTKKPKPKEEGGVKVPSTKEELELLLAGDNGTSSYRTKSLCIISFNLLCNSFLTCFARMIHRKMKKRRRITICVGFSESKRTRARNYAALESEKRRIWLKKYPAKTFRLIQRIYASPQF